MVSRRHALRITRGADPSACAGKGGKVVVPTVPTDLKAWQSDKPPERKLRAVGADHLVYRAQAGGVWRIYTHAGQGAPVFDPFTGGHGLELLCVRFFRELTPIASAKLLTMRSEPQATLTKGRPMLSIVMNALQLFLIPLLICLVVAAAVVMLFLGRQRRSPEAAPDRSPLAEPLTDDDSDFSVVAPAAPPGAVPAAASPPQPTLPLAADLLLVDDSAVARAKLRKLFEPMGYRVHLARDGVEAMALLDKGRYGLMITDLEMPNMDGVSLIGAIQGKTYTAQMPILAITGHENLQARLDECQHIRGIYLKPWVDATLVSHVAALVTTRSATAIGA